MVEEEVIHGVPCLLAVALAALQRLELQLSRGEA
jgi:hypothetical protein